MNNYRIFYYHHIGEILPWYKSRFRLDKKIFAKQIFWLKKNFKIVSLDEAVNRINKKDMSNHISLTFDDGFSSIYKIITPILEAYKVPATFFLINKSIDNEHFMWRNKNF